LQKFYKESIIIKMSTYENHPEIVLGDDSSNELNEIHTLAKELLLDARQKYEPAVAGGELGEIRADYACSGEALGQLMSRYIGIVHDSRGVQIVMLRFPDKATAALPAAEGTAVEMVSAEEDSRITVDFFSVSLEAAAIRLEGVESQATEKEILDLLTTFRHSELTEIATPELTVRYAALTMSLLRTYPSERSEAWDKFIARKTIELEDGVRQGEAYTQETAKIQANHDCLEAKIASPVKGVLSEMVEPFSRKLARRILGV
jgi:hypothetical protein